MGLYCQISRGRPASDEKPVINESHQFLALHQRNVHISLDITKYAVKTKCRNNQENRCSTFSLNTAEPQVLWIIPGILSLPTTRKTSPECSTILWTWFILP